MRPRIPTTPRSTVRHGALCLALIIPFFLATLPALRAQVPYTPDWASIDARPIPSWYGDAKFGIFIHWGVYSVPAFGPTDADNVYLKYAEWYWKRWQEGEPAFAKHHAETYGPTVTYPDFARDFTAENWEPARWAELFKRSGAKYVVLTSKHHDGFALWPSAQAWNWNAAELGPNADVCGVLAKAVRAEGLRMGYYYSLYEWFNPLYRDSVPAYVEQHMLPQMYDLVNRYEPDVVWTDGEWEHPAETWRAREFLTWLYNESPVRDKVVVNDRWGKETRGKHGGYYTTEYGLVHDGTGGAELETRPWEECRGIGGSFGYNEQESLEHYSSSEELVHTLVDVVSRGGNLLLNIGPTADGRIPVIMEQRLTDMGTWLARNGEAIYGTRRAGVVAAREHVRFTRKGDRLYVILTAWPPDGRLVLPDLRDFTWREARLLGKDGVLAVDRKKGAITLPTFTAELGQWAWVVELR